MKHLCNSYAIIVIYLIVTFSLQPKQRRKVNPDDANLDKLVNKYKDKLKSVELKKSKWYGS